MEKLLVSIKKFKAELKLYYFSSRLHPVVMVQLKSGIWMIRYSFFFFAHLFLLCITIRFTKNYSTNAVSE